MRNLNDTTIANKCVVFDIQEKIQTRSLGSLAHNDPIPVIYVFHLIVDHLMKR